MQNLICMLVNFLCTHSGNIKVQAVVLSLPANTSRFNFDLLVFDFEVSTEQSSPQSVAVAYLTPSDKYKIGIKITKIMWMGLTGA